MLVDMKNRQIGQHQQDQAGRKNIVGSAVHGLLGWDVVHAWQRLMGSAFVGAYAIVLIRIPVAFCSCAMRNWCRLQRHIELRSIALGFDHDLVAAAVELFLGFQIHTLAGDWPGFLVFHQQLRRNARFRPWPWRLFQPRSLRPPATGGQRRRGLGMISLA